MAVTISALISAADALRPNGDPSRPCPAGMRRAVRRSPLDTPAVAAICGRWRRKEEEQKILMAGGGGHTRLSSARHIALALGSFENHWQRYAVIAFAWSARRQRCHRKACVRWMSGFIRASQVTCKAEMQHFEGAIFDGMWPGIVYVPKTSRRPCEGAFQPDGARLAEKEATGRNSVSHGHT